MSEEPDGPPVETAPVADPPADGGNRSAWEWVRGHISIPKLLILAGLAVVVVWTNTVAIESEWVQSAVQRFGYLGIFGAAAISGFNLVVPVPVITFFPLFMEAGLQPALTVGIIAAGMSVGDLLGFSVGRVGREALAPSMKASHQRLERLRDAHPHLPVWVMLVYAAVVPLPNELLVVPMAFLRYPVISVMAAVLAGNVVFNSLMAFWLLEIF